MSLWLLLLFLFYSSNAVTIKTVGGPAFFPFLSNWLDAYKLIEPDFDLAFQPDAIGGGNTILRVVNGEQIDFATIDQAKPNAAQYNATNDGLVIFPYLSSSLVFQVNFGNDFGAPTDIVLNRTLLVKIFNGNITNWNHPDIIACNPTLAANHVWPNATIQVYYRTSNNINFFLHSIMKGFDAPNWPYQVSPDLPANLTSLPNFKPFSNGIIHQAALTVDKYSIGYVPYSLIIRDQSLKYARHEHIVDGSILNATGPAVTLAADSLILNDRLDSGFMVNSPNRGAWTMACYIYGMVSKYPTDCTKARELYKFLRWSLTDPIPRSLTAKGGCGALSANHTETVLKRLAAIQCNGISIAAYQASEERSWLLDFFLSVSLVAFVVGMVLSCLHIYYFSSSKINLVYSIVFIAGTTLTLLSPIFWFFEPTKNSICQARVWTGSLGFSILLGSMFSRTWQLNDIYLLQKKNFEQLKHKTVNSTLIQLGVTLVGVIAINFIILLSWSTTDPLRAIYHIEDEVRLTGYWTCSCRNFSWLLVELFFFLFLLSFGVYVIYKTWSFQRQAVITETRWVLLALYNVILNLFAVVPIMALIHATESIVALIVMISIVISGGSIVGAVLFPRIVQKFESSKMSRNANRGSSHGESKDLVEHVVSPHTTASTGTNGGYDESHNKSAAAPSKQIDTEKRKEISRTPEEELALRLEDPQPLTPKEVGYPQPPKKIFNPFTDNPVEQKTSADQIELQPLSPSHSFIATETDVLTLRVPESPPDSPGPTETHSSFGPTDTRSSLSARTTPQKLLGTFDESSGGYR